MDDRALHVSLRQSGPIPLDVAFTSGPGEVLAIFGPSGSGKSTILRSIAGLYVPTDARVRCGPDTWTDTSSGRVMPVHHRRVGFVFQDYALFPHLTAHDNVVTALGHLPRRDRSLRATQLLEQMRLAEHAGRKPSALSGGERQRVALARALARDPRVLLLDEPFAAVDRAVKRRLQDQVDDVHHALDAPLVLVTHDFDDVVRLASHLLVLHEGRAVASGPVHDVTSRPDLVWLRDAVGLGSVIEALVTHVDRERGLVTLSFEGGALVAPHRTLLVGTPVRVRIPAREVILATDAPTGLSLHNVLAGEVSALHADTASDHVVVRLSIGGVHLLAEVTRDAVSKLGIAEGRRLHALVKSVSLDVRRATPRLPVRATRR
jgi:molybdate transport system ATP-binding protein